MYDVLIVGAGTAGMTAGIYVQRAGKKALVLDEKGYGGQIVNTATVENYPGFVNISGTEFTERIHEQAVELGVDFKVEKVKNVEKKDGVFVVSTGDSQYEVKSVIIATGVKNRELGIPGEEKFKGSGVSFCATCDGNFFKGRDIAIIGGGNTALEDAEVMSGIANKVYLVHRRDEFRGDKLTVKRLSVKDNVEFVLNSKPVEITGGFAVDGLKIENTEDGSQKTLKVDGIFVAVGQTPDNKAFEGLVKLDSTGYVDAGEDCVTSAEGIFVAGDCRTKKVRQLTTAASDGSVAAAGAVEYINRME